MGREELLRKVAQLPSGPGVYLFKDAEGKILYIGKARSLRQRVRSYFQASGEPSPRSLPLMSRVADVEVILTQSEVEALVLESQLIKVHQPRYNVRLRDDKRYPFLKLTREPFPQLTEVRRPERDGAVYFGPFTHSGSMRRMAHLLRQLFRLRSCSYALTGQEEMRPCLDYHLGLCDAPCAGKISQEAYRAQVEQAVRFLKGEHEAIKGELERKMREAAAALRFEEAARYRDALRAVEDFSASQKVVLPWEAEADVLGLAVEPKEGYACVNVFFLRGGRFIGNERVLLETDLGATDAERLAAFVQQYYDNAPEVPPEIWLPFPLPEQEVVEEWLSQLRRAEGKKRRVRLLAPQRGERRALLEMARLNAEEGLREHLAFLHQQRQAAQQAVVELQEALGLPRLPLRIECYDISTTQGREAVGSMVVFCEGRPFKKDYRRFRIRQGRGQPDDYAMMREVLQRRFERALAEDPKFRDFPDLLLVDGGKGQVQVAVRVLEDLGIAQVPVAGLAKRREELFLPGRGEPILLPPESRALRLLQAVRDEAHRFANEYHRRLRHQGALHSILDDIPGIGPKRRVRLLSHFGSTAALRQASVEEIARVPGMNRALAERVLQYLREEG